MNASLNAGIQSPRDLISPRDVTPDLQQEVDQAAQEAAARIAPLWPLQSFVAVNPLLGMARQSLNETALMVARNMGARLTMPREYYAGLIADGRIRDDDIAAAIAELADELGVSTSVERVRAEVLQPDIHSDAFELPTIASLASRIDGVDWQKLIAGSISNWAADYFDKGIVVWSVRSANDSPLSAYLGVSSIDRSAEILGLADAREHFTHLPTEPVRLLSLLIARLDLSGPALVNYFHRLLADVSGWAAYARHLGWTRELRGEDGSAARQLLAIRAAWELVLLDSSEQGPLQMHWSCCRHRFLEDGSMQWNSLYSTDQILQLAFDRAVQRRLAADIRDVQVDDKPLVNQRPDVQAAFCIDVRSERLRRALESADPRIETLGFAGFFGMAVNYRSEAEEDSARCPVLLEPSFNVHDSIAPARRLALTPGDKKFLAGRWARFQRGGVAGFAYVEAFGITYLRDLVRGLFGSAEQRSFCSDHSPELAATLPERIDLAEGLLRGMSITRRFARVVMLAGHGSVSRNNPYASALDCGACGGHAGDLNARLAASVLNDRFVRAGLLERGIEIPGDTVFVAALHDTTTDDVRLLNTGQLPEASAGILADLEKALLEASRITRRERAQSLNVPDGTSVDSEIRARAGDWSQVRPEWGLAGCHAFIAAPRARTRSLDLAGRSFLHEYDHTQDSDYAVLETIMTAPLVVASWIALQYYGSTVDNKHFGSGDKTLHNVVSGIGVLEGLDAGLRCGLPLQSLHNGKEFVHEPLRLTAVIEAPRAAIEIILRRNSGLLDLVKNGWIQMHALDEHGSLWRRRGPGLDWVEVLDQNSRSRSKAA